jgi:Holliday junction resolvase RusA-like endonuclease
VNNSSYGPAESPSPPGPFFFRVYGLARPQGSLRPFKLPTGQIVTTMSNAKVVKPWRDSVASAAREAGVRQLEGPVFVRVEIHLPRPKGHFGKRGLRASAPTRPAVKPDLDKLCRAILDALTGLAWRDDAQVVGLGAWKNYTESEPFTEVRVMAAEKPPATPIRSTPPPLGVASAVVASSPAPKCLCGRAKFLASDGCWRCVNCDCD